MDVTTITRDLENDNHILSFDLAIRSTIWKTQQFHPSLPPPHITFLGLLPSWSEPDKSQGEKLVPRTPKSPCITPIRKITGESPSKVRSEGIVFRSIATQRPQHPSRREVLNTDLTLSQYRFMEQPTAAHHLITDAEQGETRQNIPVDYGVHGAEWFGCIRSSSMVLPIQRDRGIVRHYIVCTTMNTAMTPKWAFDWWDRQRR